MADRTSDPGDARRYAQRPADEAVPGDERLSPQEEWAPGDAAPGRRMAAEGRPEDRIPAEPGPAGHTDRLPGSAGPGREGLTGDDRMPEDTPMPPPGPAGVPETGRTTGAGAGQWHGTEGLRPGTEDMGAGVDDGFTASHRTEQAAFSEDGRMPDNGLGAPAVGHTGAREAGGTDSPGRDTWPAAAGGTGATAPAAGTVGGTGATAPAAGTVGATAPAGGAVGGTAPAGGAVGGTGEAPSGTGAPLLAHEESERWERQLKEVVGGFVDEPRAAVEQADRTLEEIAARFSEAVTRRRRTLRMSWEGTEGRGPGAETDTEQLRLALRDYRELAGRLLHG
ncbi:hypothetical protein [Streptomyces sp. SID486]|uniref:hypothetical protein n=1 Tax=Streptomyces sp. SID486 TaxID=2690264 RepID=UPI001F1C73FC|nr:hypothetical protein [Streptomyces sp. SID486]